MDPNRWKQIDELVDAALDLPENQRAAFVESSGNGDDDLKRAVLDLLAAQSKTNEFLQHSAMKIVAQAIADETPQVKSVSLVGQKIATYKVEKLLGAGGMGEVYLALDEKMRRHVALKILPAEYGKNDERVRRFEMEARAISKLNHPNIVTVYDIGNADGINYIATEFVDGWTLRDLIGGKFKLRNVMANSIQICDALSAAHAQGIIHRDIKPENVMIRKDGYAKILDFGVAKLTEVGPETMRDVGGHTTKGMVIGTPAYMSPAQLAGEAVDHRADIWSSGVVLYEFMTGKNPFKGANRQATFKAILSAAPEPASKINPAIPEEVDRILFKILEKDPNLGYQTAADLRVDLKRVKRELDSFSSDTFSGQSERVLRPAVRSRTWAVGIGLASLLIIAGLASAIFFRSGPAGPDWSAANRSQLTERPGTEFFPSLSPDGKFFTYASDADGKFEVFVQRVGSKVPNNLSKNADADDTQPAFSPNGEEIAFRSEREPSGIYVVGASGENLRRVADFGFHPSWSPDGREIVVSTFGRDQPTVRANGEQSLAIVNLESGARRELVKGEASFPAWSPGGKRIAYWFYTAAFGRRDIATIPVGGGEPVIVANPEAVSNWNPVWSPDGKFLYYVSSRGGSVNFWRVRIDETTGAILSEPESILTPSKFSRHLNFSRDGQRMIYVETNNQSNVHGAEFDLQANKIIGEPYPITRGDREITRAELSPDGTRFVMRTIRRTQDDIVTVSRDGNDWRDVTNDAPFDRYPRWSPDGTQLAFASDRNAGGEIWVSNADGTAPRQITFSSSPDLGYSFPVWSPDGQRLSFVSRDSRTHIIDLTKPWDQQTPVHPAPADGITGFITWDWSPDGSKLGGTVYAGTSRFLGYYSLQTQTYESIVESNDSIPAWLPDSRRMVYGIDNKIFVVDSETRKITQLVESTTALLRSPFVSRDGKLLYYAAHTSESDIWLLDHTKEK